ncbi:MAG: cation:proton antiporter [Clostridia bacterium]|nr:cation:proton antiporter [Clostridia bacterium]
MLTQYFHASETSVTLFTIAFAMIAGLLLSRLAKKVNLPAVTAYLVAGILVGPYCLGALGIPGLGFVSAENVKAFDLLADCALGFIGFTIGNEFRLSHLKHTGKATVVIGVLQALTATLIVDGFMIGLHFIFPEVITMPIAITMGAIAAATAPAATLMVVKQYKAKGKLTDLLLPIVALDDAVCLMVFAVSFGIAKSLDSGAVDLLGVIVEPLLEVVLSLVLGSVLGLLFTFVERFFKSNSKRLSVSLTFVFFTVAVSMLSFTVGRIHVAFSSLLVCMMLGTVFCNCCDFSEELMARADRWTAPLLIFFFVQSGAGLDFSIFKEPIIIIVGIVYVLARCAGKYFGAFAGGKMMKLESCVNRYLGITLFPQAGVALGLSLIAENEFGEQGLIIRNITLFGIFIYELVGPSLTKWALVRSGDIEIKKVTERSQDTHYSHAIHRKKEEH